MKRLIAALVLLLVLVGCGQSKEETIKEQRNEIMKLSSDNMEGLIALESIGLVWDIEDELYYDGKDGVDRTIKYYVENYIDDKQRYEKMNGYEKGTVAGTLLIIMKYQDRKYDDNQKLFEEDKEKFYDIYENGDPLFID